MRCSTAWWVTADPQQTFLTHDANLWRASLLIALFGPSSASLLQPEHGGDVRQHPEQAAAAETQHFQRGEASAGGPAAEGQDQAAGLHRGLCKCLLSGHIWSLVGVPGRRLTVPDSCFCRLKSKITCFSPPSTGMTSMPRRSPLHSTPMWYVNADESSVATVGVFF